MTGGKNPQIGAIFSFTQNKGNENSANGMTLVSALADRLIFAE